MQFLYNIQKYLEIYLPLAFCLFLEVTDDDSFIYFALGVGFIFGEKYVGCIAEGYKLTNIHRMTFLIDRIEGEIVSSALHLFAIKLKDIFQLSFY